MYIDVACDRYAAMRTAKDTQKKTVKREMEVRFLMELLKIFPEMSVGNVLFKLHNLSVDMY